MTSPQRVLRRFLTGGAIGDPAALLRALSEYVDDVAALEGPMGRLKQIMQDMEQAAKTADESEVWLARKTKQPHPIIELEQEWTRNGAASKAAMYLQGHYYESVQGKAQDLFLSILQAFALPPAVTKKIQAASRFWSKSLKPRKGRDWWLGRLYSYDVVEIYPKVLSELRSQVAAATEAVTKGKPHGEAEDTRLQAGPFTLVNTGNFKPDVMETVRGVVEKAAKAMTAAGFGKVCYGDIHVSKTITKSKTAAFYLLTSDEMFVRANIKGDHDTVKTVCHELAHRLQFKFLSGKQREIDALYNRIAMNVRFGLGGSDGSDLQDQEWPEQGRVVEHDGEQLTVLQVDKRRNKIEFGQPPAPGVVERKVYSAPLEWWAKNIEGREVERGPTFKGFITQYAKKDPDENFAEMVAYYAVGKLPAGLTELLTPIIG